MVAVRHNLSLLIIVFIMNSAKVDGTICASFCSSQGGLLYANTTCFYVDNSLTNTLGGTWSSYSNYCNNVASTNFGTQGQLAVIDTSAKWTSIMTHFTFAKSNTLSIWNWGTMEVLYDPSPYGRATNEKKMQIQGKYLDGYFKNNAVLMM